MPGWHTTIFPPYFVAGAVFSGFALVLTLLLITRAVFGFHHIATVRHLDLMNKFMLATGMMVGYAYALEFFIAWYSGNPYESWVFLHNRAGFAQLDEYGNWGPLWWAYWAMMLCNVISPQFFWFKWFRTNIPAMFVLTIFINIGMWFERFVIIGTSLQADYLPSSWGSFTATWVDIGLYAGTFGLFMTLFLLFIRWIPAFAIAELKNALPDAHPAHHDDHADHGADHH